MENVLSCLRALLALGVVFVPLLLAWALLFRERKPKVRDANADHADRAGYPR